jgi:heparinase II/III-like protein
MNLISKIIKKLNEEGVKDSIKTIYFNRILRPILKKYIRNKYQNNNTSLNDAEFLNLLSSSQFKKNKSDLSKLLLHFNIRTTPNFFPFFHNDENHIYKNNFSVENEETIKRADQIINHDFTWITPRCPRFKDQINWHSTFNNNNSWPLDFFMDLDYSTEKRPGDVREVWELNRQQFFITLGKAYFNSGDQKYAQKFSELVESWIKTNPCGYGINWLHSQETGIRMMSWIWAFYFFKDSVSFSEKLKIDFLKSLYQHAEFTFLTLSRGLTTHNHLVSEICGLLIFSMMFPEFKKSKKWFRISLKIYKREVLKQIWESGPSAELSTNYHLFVLDSFLQTYVLLIQNGHSLSKEISNRIEMMIEYASYFTKPDGSIPKIGDNDSGRTFRLSEVDENERRYYLSAGSVLFNRADFKKLSPKFFEEAFWLLGSEGLSKFNVIHESENIILSKSFEPTGFAVFRDGVDTQAAHLVFRGGPTKLRKNVSTSHNHADFLSFELYKNGRSILIDPGTYLYSFHDDWRFYYRKTFCHNTVSVDGVDSANVTASRFGLPSIPLSKLNSVLHTKEYDFIDMTSTGYHSIGISHRRKLLFVKQKYILVLDILEGDGEHKISQNLNIDTRNLNIDVKNNEICLSYINDLDSMSILTFSSHESIINTAKGKLDPIDGWASDKYGEKYESSIVRIEYNQQFPLVCGMFINLDSTNKFKINSFELNASDQKLEFFTEGYLETVECTELSLNYHSVKK